MYSLLNAVNTPGDLRRLDRAQLPQLAIELRQFLIESVSLIINVHMHTWSHPYPVTLRMLICLPLPIQQ